VVLLSVKYCFMKILIAKFKGKFSLSTPRGRKGGVDLHPHFFLTSALDENVWLTLRPGRFTPGKEHLHPLNTDWVGPIVGLDAFVEETSLVPSGILTPDLPILNVVAVSSMLLQSQILAVRHLNFSLLKSFTVAILFI